MSEQIIRHLAAIMFSDIAGYSAMMQRDEQEGRANARRYREVLERFAAKYGGEIWQHYGDGSLTVFASAVESLRCARSVQHALQQKPSVPVRLGIHVGDIVKEGDDIYGDGINIAARVESLGVPGSVLVTERLVFDIKNHPEFKVTPLGKFAFKNIEEPMQVFALIGKGLIVPDPKDLRGKGELLPDKTRLSYLKVKARPLYLSLGIILLLLLFFGNSLIKRQQEKQWAFNTALPEIERLIETLFYGSPTTGSGPEAWDAFELAKKTQTIIPNYPELEKLQERFSQKINLSSRPEGAKVYARPCSRVDAPWQLMGITPLDSTLFPSGNINIRIEKEGYQAVEDLISLVSENFDWHYTLDKEGSIPKDMILVRPHGLSSPLDSFLVDRYEVTNRNFKKFIEDGGYQNPDHWKHPFMLKGKILSWEEGMRYMRDKTNRSGPALWIAGDYPEGEGDHPVSGISWYEAAAYAEYMKKQLPSIQHFKSLISYAALNELIPGSNFDKAGTTEVGASKTQNAWGVYDLFGNVGEWCFNSFGETKKLILGGAWSDEGYIATFEDNAKEPFDRSPANGFRCVKLFDSIEKYRGLFKDITPTSRRDYYREDSVTDEVFEVYLKQYLYDKINLEPKLLYSIDEEHWIKEKVEISIPYQGEKLFLYLFLPKEGIPPYQTIIFYPHIGARVFESSEKSLLIKTNDFLIKNGRAVVYPIFKGTYERKFPTSRPCNDMRVCDKEDKILAIKDLMVSIDYLETRQDLDTQKLAYMGMSLGATWGGLALASEPRLKLGILKMAGFWNFYPFPEVDPVHYHPKVNAPVLMLTGRYDPYFPYQASQIPFFNSLGTNPKDKKWVTYEDGHALPRTETIIETLDFLDQYFGPVGSNDSH